MSIRSAKDRDIATIVELAEQRRLQYQRYQPTFWRKADDARAKQIPFLTSLLQRKDVLMLVHEDANQVDGFIVADFVAAPPVYNPGGPTCRVDDFCVAEENLWENVGRELLNEVLRLAKEHGAAQSVVVCGHLDQPKRSMLIELGYTIASEWHVRDL
ncbi:GNAT family N-acetyltransferase [Dictyobacter kobayashii]|uniref:N-acetyltransferase n=1 Tax=Dictyobacter kobayashii TaxID=2014872 RepID=A0A402AR33_9CHLR|nr:GNAT family N-acetyltransferase [Dictyobacter kobayashii]GCE21560.1 N-acetyltransferase [Dictyobacter kobayashii]